MLVLTYCMESCDVQCTCTYYISSLHVQWSTIFPTEQVTQQQSALFVKKLLAVAVSRFQCYNQSGLVRLGVYADSRVVQMP